MRRSLCDKVERHAKLCIVGAAGTLRDGRTLITERDAALH
jgi:hypothetical protein